MLSAQENLSGRRLFFALWPDAATRTRLAALVPALPAEPLTGARVSPAQNLHLTLAFLGTVAASAEAQLRGLAKDNAGRPPLSSEPSVPPPLTLSLDTLGCWPRGGILFAAPSFTPAGLIALAVDVSAMARAAGVAMRSDAAFRAHVTLARRVSAGVAWPWPLAEPIAWSVDRYALVWSRPTPAGSLYEVVETWPLPVDGR